MNKLLKAAPWLFVALFVTEIVAVVLPKKQADFHLQDFGRLPTLLNGRIQPMDSVARNVLLQIRSTGDVPLEQVPSWKFWHHPKKLKSSEWAAEVLFKPELADTRPIFLIHHPDLVSELKLGELGVEKSGLRYYTFNQIRDGIGEINRQAQIADGVESKERTSYQQQVLKLANAVYLYQRMKNSVSPEGTHDFAGQVQEYEAALPAGLAAWRARQAGTNEDQAALDRFAKAASGLDTVASVAYPLVVPPWAPEQNPEGWANTGASLLGSMETGQVHPAVKFYARMATAFHHDNAAAFNQAVSEYTDWLQPIVPAQVSKSSAEFFFNRTKAFLHATIIYVFVFVLAGAALLTFGPAPRLSEALRRSAFYLACLAFVVHTFGIGFRMVLEGRPPVTNLYSSAIFIGWGACLLGLILERVYRVGLGCAVAGLAGFVTLLIAHNLALGGDTMEMLRAVLDTNFWLATHVITITIGYTATFVAGLLAIAYIVLGVFTPLLTRRLNNAGADTKVRATGTVARAGASKNDSKTATAPGELLLGKALTGMVYGVVCFALFFSFVGTVLGGIWADQSWGRFWGWDPKENGALLIVLWNAIILHARWGGLVRDRGLMNLAIVGNIITAFSWFGVNMLGIGLHSYGFMDAAFKWLMLFIGSQVGIILLGLLPVHFWKSFKNTPPAPPSAPQRASGKPAQIHAAARS